MFVLKTIYRAVLTQLTPRPPRPDPSFRITSFKARFVGQSPKRFAEEMASEIVTLDEAKALAKGSRPEVLFVDVRRPDEHKNAIPTTINIPIDTLEDVLKNMPAEEFKQKYGRDKPESESEIVFHCHAGGRSTRAAKIAKDLGYTNVRNFKGGWTEWSSQ